MKKAVPAIAIGAVVAAFWVFSREERSKRDEAAPPASGSAEVAPSRRSPAAPSDAAGGGSHVGRKDAQGGTTPAEEALRGDRTPPLENPATAKDGFVEAHATSHDKPVAFAEVRLYARLRVVPGIGEQPWRVAGVAKTGKDGLVRIPARPGAYLVAVRADGFAPARKEFIRAAGDPVTRVELELGKGASLSGRTVAKGAREPVSLAQVIVVDMLRISGRGEPGRRGPFRAGRRQTAPIDEIAPVEERSTATSDQDGKFRVDGLEPGRYRVEARATGTARAALAPVAVPADGEVVLELPAASFIEGSVVDSEGKAAPGAEVIATGGPSVVYGEATDTGTFSLEVEPRTYFLSARSRDQAGKADDPVSVSAGQTARGVKIRLTPGASLAGVVVARSSSAPIPDARINLSPAGSGGSLGATTTDASGNFLIGGLAPGQYDVDIAADGFTPDQRRGLVLLEGQRFPLQIGLKANGSLQGMVHDLAGKTVAAAIVRASPQFGDPLGEARTDSTGAYQLSGIPAGRVVVSATRDGAALGARQTADVPEGGTARADLTLAEEGLLTGKVTRKGGAPILDGSATVVVSPASGRFGMGPDLGSVTVDPDGSYRASVPAGSYRITAAQAGARADLRAPPNAVFATVEAGQTVVRDVVVDDPADSQTGLSGTVLEPGGSPSAGAQVMVLNSAGTRTILIAQADETGTFHFDRARSDLPDAFLVSAVNGGRMGKTQVASGQTSAQVQLQPAASLRGRVASAVAVNGFSMTINLKQGGRAAFFGGWSGPMQRQLQFAGDQFVAEDLPATDVLVHVVTNDGRTGDGAASLVSGQPSQIEIPLQDAGNVLGRVVDENGAPVSGAFATLDRTPSLGGDERVSGTDGRFRLTNVAPGDHSYLIFSPGFRSSSGNLSLQPGQALDLGTVQITHSSTPPGNVGIGVGGSDANVQVSFVLPDGPAAKVGMQVGDQLVRIDGRPVATLSDARTRLPGNPGSTVSVTFVRNGGSPQVVTIQRQL